MLNNKTNDNNLSESSSINIQNSSNSSSSSIYTSSLNSSSSNNLLSKSNLTDPSIKKVVNNRKKVSWADSVAKPLENVQHFYLDETEKGV